MAEELRTDQNAYDASDEQKSGTFNHLSEKKYDEVKKAQKDPVINAAGIRGLEALGIDTNSNNPGGAVGVEAAGKSGGFGDSTQYDEHKVDLSGKDEKPAEKKTTDHKALNTSK